MPPLLELTDIARADLPLYEPEFLPTPLPRWLRDAAMSSARYRSSDWPTAP